MPRKTITIGIADDVQLDRTLIEHKVKSIKNTQILFRSANGLELLHKLKHYTPDALIIDLYMPVMSGWEVLAELNKQGYQGVIICTSASFEDNLHSKLRTFNVSSYSYKQGNNLGKAISEALSGRHFFDTDSTAIPVPRQHINEVEIDGREIEIINKLAEGKNALSIANELEGLSEKTVDTYIQNLVTRFECKNRTQLIALASYYGLIYTFDSFIHLPKPKPKPKPMPMEMGSD